MMYVIHPDPEHKYVVGLYLPRSDRKFKALRKRMGFPPKRKAVGFFRGYQTNFKKVIKGRIIVGYIVLDMSRLTETYFRTGVIAHECLHAAAQYLRRRKKWNSVATNFSIAKENRLREAGTPEKIPEEQLAYAVGYLTEQVSRAVKQDRKYKR